MGRKAKREDVLATLTEEERLTYVTRRASLENQFVILQALSDHLDAHINSLREKYDLPRFFDINMEKGTITKTEVPDENPVV